MKEEFSRTAMMLGEEGIEKLERSNVAVFGVGGVGGYAVEALARSGVGRLTLIDSDRVSRSNINRQIVALQSSVGMLKVEAAKTRILDINPDCKVTALPMFFLPENADSFDFSEFDYVIDAVDTVSAKVEIICRAKDAGVKVISSMGAGNKLDPTRFCVADIYETSVCPLARVIRQRLRKRNIEAVRCVYSDEEPAASMTGGERVPASNAFTPAVAGLIIAGEVIKDIVYGT